MAIKIPFVSDVTDFLRGTKQLEDSLDDVADSLDDISTAGDDIDTKVGGDLDDTARAADAAADKISKSFRTAFDEVEAAGRTTSTRVAGHVDDVGHRGSATLREFSSEAKQNVAETISSFDGSAASGVDAIQGTFGGLVSALGPAGIVGAAVAGVGIGLARGIFAKSQEAAAALREQITGIFDELRSSEGVLSKAFQRDAIAELIKDAERIEEIFGTDLAGAARLFGDDFGTVLRGLTGDSEDAGAAMGVLEQKWQEAADTGQTYVDELGNVALRNQDLADASGRLSLALKEQQGAIGEGTTAFQVYTGATKDLTDANEDNTGSLVDNNEQLRIAAGLKGEAVAAELDMKDALAGVAEAHKENGASLSTNTRAGRDNTRAVLSAIDAINEFGDAQIDAGKDTTTVNGKLEEQEAVLVRKVMKAFGLTEKQARSYIKTLGGIPPKKETDVKVSDKGTAKATSDKVDAAAKDRNAAVVVRPDLTGFDDSVKRYLNGKAYFVTVRARPGKNVPT